MSLGHGASVIRDGLVCWLDPANLPKHGSSPYLGLDGNSSITNFSFTAIDDIFRSDCVNSAVGNSYFSLGGMTLDTGSVTVQWFMNVTSSPNVDANNNWRRLIANPAGGRDPFGFVLEQGGQINFTLQTTTGNKRHINGNFTPITVSINEWNMITYTYDKDTGIASCYKNNSLSLSGPQTNGGIEPTVSGEAMTTLTSSSSMEISNNNTVSGGDACLPCDLGPWLIYNRAISSAEIKQNFESLRGRYGI